MAQENWIKVADEGAIEDEDAICVALEGRKIALFFVDGTYYATSDLCTHEVASLSQGYVDGATVECPLHQAVFCLRTGAALAAPAEKPVQTFPTKVEGGAVYVRLSED